jgi:chemotaxis protein methyltransferase CheR
MQPEPGFSAAAAPRRIDLQPSDFAYLQALLYRRTGVVLEAGREYFADSRLAGLAAIEGFPSLDELMDSLKTEEEWGYLHRRVVEMLLVTETSFFRDRNVFEALRTEVLPVLIRARQAERTLNVWCAACASGQEPHSLAILLREHFPEVLNWDLRIIATDVSQSMIERATAGRYTQLEVNRGLPAPLLVKYFEKTDKSWRIREGIRGMVEFRQMSIVTPMPVMPPMDLVLLRNLLIYFNEVTRRIALGRVASVIRPDGYLFLGGGETTLTLDGAFHSMSFDRAVGYRPAA